uniref:NADH dehydrogenase [ubiquinone] iron-sulfur protein 4, mitochondrial n=1 Tax=Heterorhabditis bacteriophora TaxID=37862 RepID=A0A1I7XH39_HETBA
MLRSSSSLVMRQLKSLRYIATGKDLPVTRVQGAIKKELTDILEPAAPKAPVAVAYDETMDIGGVPLEHQEERTARIFRSAREAPQTSWNNTKVICIFHFAVLYLIILIGDPLSNVSMNLKFATKEDAIAFCEKNRWAFEVEV